MTFLVAVGVIVVMIVSTIFNGFALTNLWGWFIVTTFGIKALTIPQAIGISSLISFITYQHIDTQASKEDSKIKLLSAIFTALLRPLFAIIFGWVIFQFM